MERITVNLEKTVGAKLKAKAEAEKRSASGYVELLIENDLRAAGLLPDGSNDAAFVAKVAAAAKGNPGIRSEIEKVIRSNTRARRAA